MARDRTRAIDEAFAAMAEVDRLMSNYRDDSELSMINRSAATRSVQASDPMFSVLTAAHDVSARSGGAFDVTVGPLVRLWGFHDKKPHVPTSRGARRGAAARGLSQRPAGSRAAHRSLRASQAWRSISAASRKASPSKSRPTCCGVMALEGFIDAGGNQYLLGTPPGKRLWTVGIKNPVDPRRAARARSTQTRHRCRRRPTTPTSSTRTAGRTATFSIRTRSLRRTPR